MICDQRLGQRDDVLGLVAIQADGLDRLAQPILPERHHLFRRIDRREQRARGFVHAHIGRLSGERHGYQKRKRVHIFQLAARHGVCIAETPEDLGDFGLAELRPALCRGRRPARRC
jgi:hypothetical protein